MSDVIRMGRTPRYKDRNLQRLYDGMLALAADPESELYWKGRQRTGASHRCAFWNGYNGTGREPGRMTLAWICWQAGREWAKRTKA